MKNALIIALSLFIGQSALANQAQVPTVCGIFRMLSSDGLAAVMTPTLQVKVGKMTPAFITYYLSNAGRNFSEVEARAAMIDQMVDGAPYCVTGVVEQTKNYRQYLTPLQVKALKTK